MEKLLLLLLLVGGAGAYELVVLHTNDVHAHFEQFNQFGSECTPTDATAGNCFGGYARRATVLKQIRAQEANTILVSGGDWSQGTVWYYAYEGMAAALMMNHLNYTAGGIGNHEYDKGIDVFVKKFLKIANFPILSANTDASQEPAMMGEISKSTVVTVGGKKIGIIGYTTSEMPELSLSFGNLQFSGEVPAIQQEARRLKDSGVDILIAIGHSGFPMDKEIAKMVPEIDVVVGGHDNTFMYNGANPSGPEVIESEYPHVVKQDGGRDVPVLVVQDYMFGKYLGYLKIKFDAEGEVESYSGNPILLNSTYAEDPQTLELMRPMQENITALGSKVIGHSFVALPIDWTDEMGKALRCRFRECAIGNLLTDAMIYKNLEQPEGTAWARVSLAVWNSGGIRGGMNIDMKGPITNANILEAMPFGNEVVIITVLGSTLVEMFESSVSRIEEEKGRFLQVSGFRVTYNVNKPVGSRVVSVLLRCSDCSHISYYPLVRTKAYQMLVASYLAGGGDGYSVLRDNQIDNKPLGFIDSDMVREYISERQPIFPEIQGRILFTDDDETSDASSAAGSLPLMLLAMCAVAARNHW